MQLRLRALICILLFFMLTAAVRPATPQSITTHQALAGAREALLPQGTDSVLLWIWGPIAASTEIRSTRELVLTAPVEGYAIYIDDYPAANLFHPVRYAFVNSSTGEVTTTGATNPPLNYQDYLHVQTASEKKLASVPNRRAPWGSRLQAPPPTRGQRWAVLMNGGYNVSYNWSRYWNDLSNIYITLNHTYDYPDGNIIVLCSDGLDPTPDQPYGVNSDPDLDGDGDADITCACRLNEMDSVFAVLAQQLSSDDKLFIYSTDHGDTYGGWHTLQNLWNLEELTDTHFQELLSALPVGVEIVCTFQPCYSGGFLDDIIVPPGPIVASTAAAYNQLSWAMPSMDYDAYSFYWTAAIKGEDAFGNPANADDDHNGLVTMDEAYTYAQLNDPTYEDPQYGDYPHGAGADISFWPVSLGPCLVVSGQTIDDVAGNNNGFADPGENLDLTLSISNTGSGQATDIAAAIATTSPYLSIMQNNATYPNLEHFQTGQGSPAYHLEVAPECPQGEVVNCSVQITAGGGYASADTIYFMIGDTLFAPVGPDAYGYRAYDNVDVPGGSSFNWVEVAPAASGPGIALDELTGQDNQSALINLPFTFQYYGLNYIQATICTNGWVALGDASPDSDGSNSAIPNFDGPPAMLAPFWDNLRVVGGGQIAIWHDAEVGRFIVEFYRVRQNALYADVESFEVILYDPALHPTSTGDGQILFQYAQVMEPLWCTVGIENPTETSGLQCLHNNSYDLHAAPIEAGRAILFTTAVNPGAVTVELTPFGAPIQIAPEGGSFSFNIAVTNQETTWQNFEVWTDLDLPEGSAYGPLLGPIELTLPAGAMLNRERAQNVPGSAPAGNYLYQAHVGDYPSVIWNSDSFGFVKLGSTPDGDTVDWSNSGESFAQGAANLACVSQKPPDQFVLCGIYPNPFNATTTIAFALPEAAWVNLQIYDISGKKVASLMEGWQSAGKQQISFDGAHLASGIYLYHVEMGNYKTSGKIALIK